MGRGQGMPCVGHSCYPEAKIISKASDASMKMCFKKDRKHSAAVRAGNKNSDKEQRKETPRPEQEQEVFHGRVNLQTAAYGTCTLWQ